MANAESFITDQLKNNITSVIIVTNKEKERVSRSKSTVHFGAKIGELQTPLIYELLIYELLIYELPPLLK